MPHTMLTKASKRNHICTISDPLTDNILPSLPLEANCCVATIRCLRNMTLISDRNPRTSEYYKSLSELAVVTTMHLKNYRFIIHPFSIFRVYYEMWMGTVFLMALITLPILASFNHKLIWFAKLDYFVRIACLVDIVVTFFTGYSIRRTKTVILSFKKIAWNYMFGIHFISDLLSSFPTVLCYQHAPTHRPCILLHGFGLLKITRAPTLFLYMKRTIEFYKAGSVVFKALKLITFTFVIIHWVACIHRAVPRLAFLFESEKRYKPQSWIMYHSIENATMSRQYTKSFFRALSLMLRCKTELSTAEVWEEMILNMLTTLGGHMYFIFINVMMLEMYMLPNALYIKFYEKITQVSNFMKQKNLSPALQQRIENYYDYKYNSKLFKENVITELFPDKLKKQLSMYMCKKFIHNVNIFADIPLHILEEVVTQLIPEIFLPNDIIIEAGSIGDHMYFLASGTVSVMTLSGKEICHLQDGAYFGEVSLLVKDKRRIAHVVAIETCQLYKLMRTDFKKCFVSQPQLLERLQQLAAERTRIAKHIDQRHKDSFYQAHKFNEV